MGSMNTTAWRRRVATSLIAAIGMTSGPAMAADTSLPVREVPSLQAFQPGSTTLRQAITLLGQPAGMGTDHAHGATRQVVRWRGLTPESNEHGGVAQSLGQTAAHSAVSSTIRHGLGRLFGSMSSDSTAQSIANDVTRDTAYRAGSEAEASADRQIERSGNGQQAWTCTLYFSRAGTYQSGRCVTDH